MLCLKHSRASPSSPSHPPSCALNKIVPSFTFLSFSSSHFMLCLKQTWSSRSSSSQSPWTPLPISHFLLPYVLSFKFVIICINYIPQILLLLLLLLSPPLLSPPPPPSSFLFPVLCFKPWGVGGELLHACCWACRIAAKCTCAKTQFSVIVAHTHHLCIANSTSSAPFGPLACSLLPPCSSASSNNV